MENEQSTRSTLMRWASSMSEQTELEEAVGSAAAAIEDQMDGDPVDLALAFISPHHASRYSELPALLLGALPHRTLIGCSAGGVIGGGHEVEQRPGFSLTAARLPGVEIKAFAIERLALPDLDASPRAWHEAIAVPPEPAPHFILLVDPFSFPAEDFLAGLDFAYPESVKIGGLASAAQRPGANALYLDAVTRSSGAVGVALSGDIAVDTVVAQGCRPIGRPMQITKAERNYILQLDGRSPIQVIRELIMSLPEEDRNLARNSLFVGILQNDLATEPERGDYLIRNILGMEPEHGALAIGELLREGQLVRFHLRDARTAAEDVSDLLGRFATQGTSGEARGALLFSCLGRGMLLYGHPDHDTVVFKEKLGDLPVGGFFCSGEIGPVGGATRLHGYTSSFGIFRSAAARGS